MFVKHEVEDATSACVRKSDCDCDSSHVPSPQSRAPLRSRAPNATTSTMRHHGAGYHPINSSTTRHYHRARHYSTNSSTIMHHTNTTASPSRLLRAARQTKWKGTAATLHIMIFCKILKSFWKIFKAESSGQATSFSCLRQCVYCYLLWWQGRSRRTMAHISSIPHP